MPHLPRPIWLAARLAVFGGVTGVGLWGLAQNPLALPLAERSLESSARAIERAFQRDFAPEPAIRAALAEENTERALWLADLAEEEARPLPADLNLKIEELRSAQNGILAQTRDCAVCAWDIAACKNLMQITACALPVELSPLGDANALARQGMKALAGEEVDGFETGLALVGLAATGAVVLTAGSSAVVKGGATLLRSARRLGSLTPGLSKALREAADLPLNWSAAVRLAPVNEITDAAKLGRLASMATDVGRIAINTSPAETLRLLRYADSADDAARLARVSDVARGKTLSRMEVLGKSRVFRATLRISDLAITALAAIWGAITSLAMLIAGWIGRALLAALKPPKRRKIEPVLRRKK